jgi:hypothetical protein
MVLTAVQAAAAAAHQASVRAALAIHLLLRRLKVLMVGLAPQHQIIPAAVVAVRVLLGVFQLPTVLITALAETAPRLQYLVRQ